MLQKADVIWCLCSFRQPDGARAFETEEALFLVQRSLELIGGLNLFNASFVQLLPLSYLLMSMFFFQINPYH